MLFFNRAPMEFKNFHFKAFRKKLQVLVLHRNTDGEMYDLNYAMRSVWFASHLVKQGQKVQTALLPGLIPTLKLARLQYFWVGGTTKTNKFFNLLRHQHSLAWKSMKGLSKILRSQLDSRIPKTLVVRKAESRSLNVVLCFDISHYQIFSDLGCVALAHAPSGLRIQLWAGDLAPASAAAPLAVLSLSPHGLVIWQV